MEQLKELVQQEVYHREFNLSQKDNIDELPHGKAVFGIFGIVDNAPINCRYVGTAENLREAVKTLFEQEVDKGLQMFMQGPWIQMLQYQLMDEASEDTIQREVNSWKERFDPKVDEAGDYPGYYD